MESQDYWGLGLFFIVLGVGVYFGGEYINSDFWLILQYGQLGNQLSAIGPVVVILGVALILLGIFNMDKKKKAVVVTPIPPIPVSDEKTTIKYCGYCGTANPINYVFCSKCGKKLAEVILS